MRTYKEVWEETNNIWQRHFEGLSELRIGYQQNLTNGDSQFIETACTYCQLNSGGEHGENCPLRRIK